MKNPFYQDRYPVIIEAQVSCADALYTDNLLFRVKLIDL